VRKLFFTQVRDALLKLSVDQGGGEGGGGGRGGERGGAGGGGGGGGGASTLLVAIRVLRKVAYRGDTQVLLTCFQRVANVLLISTCLLISAAKGGV